MRAIASDIQLDCSSLPDDDLTALLRLLFADDEPTSDEVTAGSW